jgi:phosphomannomutase
MEKEGLDFFFVKKKRVYSGLRARMEAGFSRMNNLTVLQASQGLAVYMEKRVRNALERGIVIGHDHRHHSQEFARLTAAAFVERGFRVWYYNNLVHTPLVVKCYIAVHASIYHLNIYIYIYSLMLSRS